MMTGEKIREPGNNKLKRVVRARAKRRFAISVHWEDGTPS